MKVRKAIIPAAGLGTRVLPASKAVPKELLPIVDKPALQYIVEEAVAAGIEDILIITNRGKGLIEDHFDRAPELEERLLAGNKTDLYEATVAPANLANIYFIRQKETKGLGHAVLAAKQFVGDEPFAVLYGDDVIIGDVPTTRELLDAYDAYGKGAVCIKEVPKADISKYSSLAVAPIVDRIYSISDMVEKPAPEEVLSLFSILGRCVLPPEIFSILENTAPGAGGEIQLTDAMKELARTKGMVGVDFLSKRYDMGNKLGIMMANCEVAINHPEIGKDFREYIKKLAATL